MADFENETSGNTQNQKKWGCLIVAIVFVVFFVVAAMIVGVSSWSESEKKSNTHYIGETVSDGNVSIKVTEVENAQSFGLYSTKYNFVIIYFDVTNRSNSSISINPLYCKLTSGSTEYSWQTYDNDALDIVAGGSESLYLVYETTQTTEEATFVISFGYNLTHMQAIDITLK